MHDAFTLALAWQAARKMRVGNALQGDVEQGPLINQAALTKACAHGRRACKRRESADRRSRRAWRHLL